MFTPLKKSNLVLFISLGLVLSVNAEENVPVPGSTAGWGESVPVPGGNFPLGETVPVPGAPAAQPPPVTTGQPAGQMGQPVSVATAPQDIANGNCDQSALIPGVSNKALGSVVGGIVGGLLGAQVGEGKGNALATFGGAIAGVIAGGMLTEAMVGEDYTCASRALEYAAPGQMIGWQNPDTKAEYRMTPGTAYLNSQGQSCRNYTLLGIVGGKDGQTAEGTACRKPDGSWQVSAF